MNTPDPLRRSFEHRGLSLSYLDSAPGDAARPAVLLLHGFPDDAELWRAQIAALHAQGYRAIAPDTVGCGESEIAPRVADYHARAISSDHLALLDHLGIPRAHVVGHDWGAILAWLLAGHAPARVSSLTVLSVGHPTAYARAGLRQKLKAWYAFFFLLGGFSEWLLLRGNARALRTLLRGHPDGRRASRQLARPGRLTAALRIYRANARGLLMTTHPRVSAPTLGVYASRDVALVESQMRDSGQWVDGSWQYERVEGGHWIPLEHPQRLEALLLAHLARASAPH